MENNWEPRVGQKVVALETSIKTYDMQIIKGKIYTVEQCFQCKCGKWVVCLLELFNKWEPINIFCHMTGGVWKYAGGPTSKFAPIEYYPDQTSEIAKQFKEHPDTVDQPVKVLETSN